MPFSHKAKLEMRSRRLYILMACIISFAIISIVSVRNSHIFSKKPVRLYQAQGSSLITKTTSNTTEPLVTTESNESQQTATAAPVKTLSPQALITKPSINIEKCNEIKANVSSMNATLNLDIQQIQSQLQILSAQHDVPGIPATQTQIDALNNKISQDMLQIANTSSAGMQQLNEYHCR